MSKFEREIKKIEKLPRNVIRLSNVINQYKKN